MMSSINLLGYPGTELKLMLCMQDQPDHSAFARMIVGKKDMKFKFAVLCSVFRKLLQDAARVFLVGFFCCFLRISE